MASVKYVRATTKEPQASSGAGEAARKTNINDECEGTRRGSYDRREGDVGLRRDDGDRQTQRRPTMKRSRRAPGREARRHATSTHGEATHTEAAEAASGQDIAVTQVCREKRRCVADDALDELKQRRRTRRDEQQGGAAAPPGEAVRASLVQHRLIDSEVSVLKMSGELDRDRVQAWLDELVDDSETPLDDEHDDEDAEEEVEGQLGGAAGLLDAAHGQTQQRGQRDVEDAGRAVADLHGLRELGHGEERRDRVVRGLRERVAEAHAAEADEHEDAARLLVGEVDGAEDHDEDGHEDEDAVAHAHAELLRELLVEAPDHLDALADDHGPRRAERREEGEVESGVGELDRVEVLRAQARVVGPEHGAVEEHERVEDVALVLDHVVPDLLGHAVAAQLHLVLGHELLGLARGFHRWCSLRGRCGSRTRTLETCPADFGMARGVRRCRLMQTAPAIK
ncbi:hypothetical protein ON010_g16908 [Phytophthora cinnamomi]|nr:hypothetical protein ON010_g16908 [Phytophthora cinnamomi]